MTASIIDGRAIAAQIKAELKDEISRRTSQGCRAPGLAVVLAGDDPASAIYVRNKRQACEALGIRSFYHKLPESVTQQELYDIVTACNENSDVDGILVQLPLPERIEETAVIEMIRADKDVDGFHPYNVGRLAQRNPALRACTPRGVMHILREILGADLRGRSAVIVGASNIVGRPMALELLLAGCTVTVTHRFTPPEELKHYTGLADILVAAAGKPRLIPGEWIKPGATVIDVGINRLPDGSLCGDVDFAAAAARAAHITPVPGGVGPLTVAMLMRNTVDAWLAHTA